MADLRAWLLQTFDSPERTAELLQPELDAGLISYHDYELAKAGLPPQHTLNRWFGAGTGVAAALLVYGRFIRIPRARPQFYAVTAPLPAFIGGSIGLYKEFQAKRRLFLELENPDSFATAILNVRDRLQGPPGRIRFGRPDQRPPAGSLDGSNEAQVDFTSNAQSDGVVQITSDRSVQSQTADSANNTSNRWSEIRRANSQQAGRITTWDVLRQQQHVTRPRETTKADTVGSKNGPGPTINKDEERAIEQAQFDAMLEAERKIASDAK